MEQVSHPPPQLQPGVLSPTGQGRFGVPITSWCGAAPSHQPGPPWLCSTWGREAGLDPSQGHRGESPWGGTGLYWAKLGCTGLDCAGLGWTGLT